MDIIYKAEALNNHETHTEDQMEVQYLIQCLGGPMTIAKAKLDQETLQKMMLNLMEVQLHDGTQHKEAHMRKELLICIVFLERE